MTKFDIAFNEIIDNEGGYTNDPDDPGGETNFGITQKELNSWYKILKIPAHVKDLTLADAKVFYKTYWDAYHYEDIDSTEIATKIFDLTVNLGVHESHIITQRAINQCWFPITVDGILGPSTLYAINSLHIANKDAQLHQFMRQETVKVYNEIVERKPRLKKFLAGWVNRANE